MRLFNRLSAGVIAVAAAVSMATAVLAVDISGAGRDLPLPDLCQMGERL